MEFSIKFDKVKSEWSGLRIYIEDSQVQKNCIKFYFSEVDFILANSSDPDEMPHYAAFHLGLHYLPLYLFRWFQSLNGLIRMGIFSDEGCQVN